MKYFKKIFSLFLWMIAGILISAVCNVFVGELYRFLSGLLPGVFPSYDIVNERDMYYAMEETLLLFALALSIFCVTYISLTRDNDRFEYIITKTDGFYEIKDVLKTYVDKFALSDIISCIINGTVFSVPMFFIPIQFIERGTFIATLAEPYKNATEAFGLYFGAVFVILALAISHLIILPFALRYYRAKWLSGFAEVAV